jgi:transcriptional pleiotropic regulator of transition state genes
MNVTGITRHIDELGRIVVPAELRRSFGIGPGDALDFSVDADTIVLRKSVTSCVFCHATEGLVEFRDAALCQSCLADLRSGEAARSGGEAARSGGEAARPADVPRIGDGVVVAEERSSRSATS